MRVFSHLRGRIAPGLPRVRARVASGRIVRGGTTHGVGNILADGDSVTVAKDLKVKGASSALKAGTKVRNIRLVDEDHNIDCKIEGFGPMKLKSEFGKKAQE